MLPRRISAGALLVAIHVASLVLLSVIAFRRNAHSLFLRWDGHLHLSLAKQHFDWMPFAPSSPMNLLQGVGDLFFPTFYKLMPAFLIGHLAGGDPIRQRLTLGILAVELFLAVVFLGTALRFTLRASLLAAWLSCLLFMPYVTPTFTYIRVWGNPPLVEAIAITAAIVGLAVHAARGDARRCVLLGAAATLLLGYLMLTQAAGGVLAAPVVAYFLAVAAFTAENRPAARRLVLVCAAGAAVVVVAFGTYLYGLYGFSVPALFWTEFLPTALAPSYASFLFHPHEQPGTFGQVYFACVVAGAVAALWQDGATVRRFALGYLAFLAALWGGVLLAVAFFDGVWRGPPPAYLDMMALPLQALFVAVLLESLVAKSSWLWSAEIRTFVHSTGARWLAAGAAIPWLVLAAKPEVTNSQWPWPPRSTPIIGLLAKEIGIAPGSPYRGRMVNLAGGHDATQASPFLSAYHVDEVARAVTGNDHRYMGPWYFNIPTLHLSNQFYSPFYNLVNMRLLNRPNTKNARPQTQTTEFDPRILRSLGVSWVIDEVQRGGEGITVAESIAGIAGRTLYLHRLQGANTGDWSPTQVVRAADLKSAISNLADPKLDLRRTAIAFEALPEDLVPAHSSGIVVQKDGFSVEASSPGKSLLLLPVEYSHCLVPHREPGSAEFRLLRLNVNLTGVLFTGKLRALIGYRYGPFVNPGCRLEDWQDARALKLAETQNWWPR